MGFIPISFVAMILRSFLATFVGLFLHTTIAVLASAQPNLAPLYDLRRSDKIPNSYLTMLYFTLPGECLESLRLHSFTSDRGYNIEDHWQAISTDLSSSPGFDYWRYFFGYTAKLVCTFSLLIIVACLI